MVANIPVLICHSAPPTPFPIALCFSVLPREWYPEFATDLLDGFLKDYGDPLVGGRPVWFVALIVFELALELPFCCVAVYAYLAKRNWIRVPAIVYASHVATNMIAILGELLAHAGRAASGENRAKAVMLLAFYLPYAVMPLAILVYMCANPTPFGPPASRAKGSKKEQ